MLPLLALLSLAPAAPPPEPAPIVQDDDLEAELSALRGRLVTLLEELAGEAHEAKLYLQRDRLYVALIDLDPEHAAARKALGYRKTREGPWEQRRYREPKDRGKKGALAAFEAQRAARSADLRGQLLRLLDGVAADRRLEALRAWLILLPDDAELRAAAGESRAPDGSWQMTDALAAREHREQVEGLLRLADESRPTPQPWKTPADVAAAIGEPDGWSTPVARIGGDVHEDEAHGVLDAVWRASRLLPVVLPVEEDPMHTAWRSEFTLYLLQSKGELPQLLRAFPDLPANKVRLYPQLVSGWLEGAEVVGVWGLARPGRLDAATRQTVAIYLRNHFALSSRHGWAWEGFGTLLTHAVAGTRLTFYVRESRYEDGPGPNLSERLRASDADWLRLFTEEMERPKPPQLVFLMGKDVNGLDERELLMSHALAKWLLETRPEETLRILDRLGRGDAGATVLEEELGMSLAFLEEHLVRWATATRGKKESRR